MFQRKSPYTFNTTKQLAKTADYTVLYTDEQIDVTPTANTVLTLPQIKDLAANGLGAKAYKFTKQGTGRYTVKIAPAGVDTIMVAGASQSYIFINNYGDEVVIVSDPVMQQWRVIHSSLGLMLGVSISAGKEGNITIETNALTGQINGMEIAMSGPNGAATGSNSFTTIRIHNFVVGTNVMTARAMFVGCYSHNAVTSPFSGQQLCASFEVGNALSTDAVTTGVIELCTRSAQGYAVYHKASGYIQIRDYHASKLGAGALPNLFSFMDQDMAWTIPATDVDAIVTTSSDQLQTHAIRINVGGTPLWIMCTNDTPD